MHWRVVPGGAPLAFEQDGSLWRIVRAGGGTCPYPYVAKVCVRVPATGTLLGVGGGRLLVRTRRRRLARAAGRQRRRSRIPTRPRPRPTAAVVVELANGKLTSGTRALHGAGNVAPRRARAAASRR